MSKGLVRLSVMIRGAATQLVFRVSPSSGGGGEFKKLRGRPEVAGSPRTMVQNHLFFRWERMFTHRWEGWEGLLDVADAPKPVHDVL